MKRLLGVMLAAIVAGVGAVPAWAASGDDVATLMAEMKTADAGVHVMRMQLTSPMGVAGSMTVDINPLRSHTEMASGPLAMEMYFADGYMYERFGNGAWKKHPMPATTAMPDTLHAFTDSTHLTLDPDVTEAGVRYGAFDIQFDTASVPGLPATPAMKMTCTYDKKTYLRHDCKSDFLTQTFRYNNPNDVIALPAELADAVDGGPFPFPLPALTAPQVAQAKPDPASAAPDRAVSLVGTWSCESMQHSTGTWTYTRNPDDSIKMKNVFRTANGLSGEYDDTYRFDAKTGHWMWTSAQANFPGSNQESGMAGRWTGDKWTFEGQQVVKVPPPEGSIEAQQRQNVQPIRSVYTTLGADAFRHEMETFRNGTWVTGSASTCKRA